MRPKVLLPLAILFIAQGVFTNAQKAEAEEERLVAVAEGAPLTVECVLRVEQRAEWLLNGAALPADLRPAGESAAGARLTARLHAPAARPRHAGVYTCARPPSQRVRVRVRAATAPPAEAAAGGAAPAAGDNGTLVLRYYDVGRPFALNCTAPRADPGQEYVWRKNGTVLEKVGELQGRYSLTADGSVLNVQGRSHEDDFGNYTCAAGEGTAHGWELRGRPHVRLPPNTNVVEGQKLKIVCKVTGKPYPAVSWTFSNDTENGTDVVRALGDRVVLQRSEAGVPDAELVVEVAQASDAGLYNCTLPEGTTDATRVRVKGMYAALWPFLGICAEVFVLCAIILVYERRRTKPELDDSDTDNHEQKKS